MRLGLANVRLPRASAPPHAGQLARASEGPLGGPRGAEPLGGRGPGPTRAAARPTTQERAKHQCTESAAVPSRAMLPWTVIGLALSLRLARSGAERGE